MEHGRAMGGDGPTGCSRSLAKQSLVLGAFGLALGVLFYGLGDQAEPVCTDGLPFAFGLEAGIALIVASLAIVAGFTLALSAVFAKGSIRLVPIAIAALMVDVVVVLAAIGALDQHWKLGCGG